MIISHALPLVMEYCDRIIVLRHGRKVADLPSSEATPERLVSLIVGFDPALVDFPPSGTDPYKRIANG